MTKDYNFQSQRSPKWNEISDEDLTVNSIKYNSEKIADAGRGSDISFINVPDQFMAGLSEPISINSGKTDASVTTNPILQENSAELISTGRTQYTCNKKDTIIKSNKNEFLTNLEIELYRGLREKGIHNFDVEEADGKIMMPYLGNNIKEFFNTIYLELLFDATKNNFSPQKAREICEEILQAVTEKCFDRIIEYNIASEQILSKEDKIDIKKFNKDRLMSSMNLSTKDVKKNYFLFRIAECLPNLQNDELAAFQPIADILENTMQNSSWSLDSHPENIIITPGNLKPEEYTNKCNFDIYIVDYNRVRESSIFMQYARIMDAFIPLKLASLSREETNSPYVIPGTNKSDFLIKKYFLAYFYQKSKEKGLFNLAENEIQNPDITSQVCRLYIGLRNTWNTFRKKLVKSNNYTDVVNNYSEVQFYLAVVKESLLAVQTLQNFYKNKNPNFIDNDLDTQKIAIILDKTIMKSIGDCGIEKKLNDAKKWQYEL